MKKLYSLLAMLIVSLTMYAQNPFFEVVNYRGAFAPAPATPWTDGWTNWNPQVTDYDLGRPTLTVTGSITANRTWSSDTVYILSGLVYVKNATLTIRPGTIVRGDATVANSSLVITKGAKINAVGNASNPIVFTSSKAAGERLKGDWGGLIILGKSTVNKTGGIGNIEGIATSTDTEYGGGTSPDDNDNSGNLKYVRIEYGGYVFATDQEINGLTLGAVGRNTIIDYVQCSYINDDAFEWFGGTVNASHLVAYKCLDDNFDTDNGYSGSVQFCLGIRDANISDQSAGSTSEGFESDNDAAGSANTPQTTCVFSNVTDISGFLGNPTSTYPTTFKFRRSARLRRNSGIKILNSILTDAPVGVFIDGTACRANMQTGVTVFKNNIIAGCLRAFESGTASTLADSLFNNARFNNDSLTATAGLMENPYDTISPDFRPAAGSIALSDVNFTDAAFNNRKIIITAASFIREVSYRGAFAPAPSIMWTDGWTNWDPNSTEYPAPTVTVTGTITTNTTWTATNTYLISGPVFVASGVVLTIQPGTVVRGDATVPNSSLIITKNAQLIANGTVSSPIVFTSSKDAGSRALGDWGGVILLGRASYNGAGGVGNIEGLAVSTNTEFGGGATPNDNDNSGSLKYVRIEFGGYIFATDKEINGLTLGAVGRGTTIDYVQCSFVNDDAFEWFGGSVNCAHLVAYRCLDDDFDTDNGFSGSVQFCLGVRDPQISDQSSGSTSEGFESDNDATGSANLPQTKALFSNITEIGPFRGTVQANNSWASTFKFRRAARIRRNTGLKVFNSIFMDYPYGVFMDGTAVRANLQNGATKFKNNLIAGSTFATEPGTLAAVKDSLFGTGTGLFKNDSLATTANVLTTPYNFTAPDYRPGSNPLVTTGAAFTDAAFNGLLAPCDEVNAPGTMSGPGNVYGCTASQTQTYSIPAIVNATNYYWSVPAGITILSGQGTRTITVAFSTTYVSGNVISVVGKNDCGNSSVPASKTIYKTSAATPASVTGPINSCLYIDGEATYTAPVLANGYEHFWVVGSVGQLVSGQGTNTIQVYYPSAVVRDSVKVAAKGACVTSAFKVLVVTNAVPANPSVLTGSIDVCAKIGSNAVSDTVIYKTRTLANVNGYLWTVPANVNIVGGNGSNTLATVDTQLVVTFNSAFVSGGISVRASAPCGNSVSVKSLTVYKRVSSAPSTIAEGFNGSVAIPAKTVVCGLASATYKIRKVSYATSYNWSMKNGTYATITHLNAAGINDTAITVTFLTGYTRDTLQVQSVTPCSVSANKIAILTALAAPPALSTLTSGSGNTTPCIGDVVTYTAVALTPTTSQSAVAVYRWTKPNFTTITSATADSSSITVSYNTGFTGGTITAKTQSACGIAGSAKTLYLQYLPPTPTAITSSTGIYNFCIGSTATFTATVPAPSTSQRAAIVYRWTKPNNTVIIAAAADSSNITLQFNTGYTGGAVTVKGQTDCGAQGSAKSQSITHTGCPTGTRGLFTETEVKNEVKAGIFPNPNKGNFTVTIETGLEKATKATIQIMDVTGRMIKQLNAVNNNGVIVAQVSDNTLSSGIYNVKYTVDTFIGTIKMVVNP